MVAVSLLGPYENRCMKQGTVLTWRSPHDHSRRICASHPEYSLLNSVLAFAG